MFLSGLALAGANPRVGGDGEDGILTAAEASRLDLDGVELVVLSACATALGKAASCRIRSRKSSWNRRSWPDSPRSPPDEAVFSG